MDVVEKWGDDVESAVELALSDLKASRDEVEVTVLEQPSRGFLGIGAKLALVRVERIEKKSDSAPEEGKEEEKQEKIKSDRPSIEERVEVSAAKAEKNAADSSARPKKNKGNRGKNSSGRHRKDYSEEERSKEKKEKLPELNLRRDFQELPEVDSHPALDFLKEVVEQMGLHLTMKAKADDKNVYIEISGADSGTIIGKRGQTLDAIQYLTSLAVNKDHKEYVKVIIDAEGYRSRREKTLEQLAERLARKVVKTGRSVKLEPMNPYERKVIHATLQSDPKVTTRSEGLDPYRRVIIELA